MYRWGLFHILKSEQYKFLIMSVIKFCMGNEGGKKYANFERNFLCNVQHISFVMFIGPRIIVIAEE